MLCPGIIVIELLGWCFVSVSLKPPTEANEV